MTVEQGMQAMSNNYTFDKFLRELDTRNWTEQFDLARQAGGFVKHSDFIRSMFAESAGTAAAPAANEDCDKSHLALDPEIEKMNGAQLIERLRKVDHPEVYKRLTNPKHVEVFDTYERQYGNRPEYIDRSLPTLNLYKFTARNASNIYDSLVERGVIKE